MGSGIGHTCSRARINTEPSSCRRSGTGSGPTIFWRYPSASIKEGKMSKKHTQSGLDGRCRDLDGTIRQKRGDTLIGTLRGIYGDDFAQGRRSDMRLDTLLDKKTRSP